MTILEIKEEVGKLQERANVMIDAAKSETRDLTETENVELEEIRSKIEGYKTEIEKLEEEEQRNAEKATIVETKNIPLNNKMEKMTAAQRFKEEYLSGKKEFTLNAEDRAVVVTGDSGIHDAAIETEIQGILSPLYARSILTRLGVRWKTGYPMGDVQYPKMTKGTVGFVGEVDPAQASTNGFSYVTLRPHRCTSYTDVSIQTLKQDTIGVFNAVMEDQIKKLDEYIESVFFGDTAATDLKPAGIFYDKALTTLTTFKDVCDFEATVANNNVSGQMKYALSNKAKAYLRSTIKGTNATGMILEANDVDGTPAEWTSNITDEKLIYGNWDNVVVANWGNVDIKIDDSIQYANGLVRIYVTTYIDWAVLRDEAFAFGKTYTA